MGKKKKSKNEFLNKKIIILCEGKTEKIFISFLKKILDSKVQIKYDDLKGQIGNTNKKIQTLTKQYKNINKIFLVCDNEHEKEIQKNEICNKVISKPSIEIIILLFLKIFEETKLITLVNESIDNIIKEIENATINQEKYEKNGKHLMNFLDKQIKKENIDFFEKNIQKIKKIYPKNLNLSFCEILNLFNKQSKK